VLEKEKGISIPERRGEERRREERRDRGIGSSVGARTLTNPISALFSRKH
jgi:hypothetical protein